MNRRFFQFGNLFRQSVDLAGRLAASAIASASAASFF